MMRVLGLQAPQKRHKGMIFTTDMAVSWKHKYAPSCLLRSETRAGLAYKNPNDKHTTKKQDMGVSRLPFAFQNIFISDEAFL